MSSLCRSSRHQCKLPRPIDTGNCTGGICSESSCCCWSTSHSWRSMRCTTDMSWGWPPHLPSVLFLPVPHSHLYLRPPPPCLRPCFPSLLASLFSVGLAGAAALLPATGASTAPGPGPGGGLRPFRLCDFLSEFQRQSIDSRFRSRSACQDRLTRHVWSVVQQHYRRLAPERGKTNGTATAPPAPSSSGKGDSPAGGCASDCDPAGSFSSLFSLLLKQIPALVLPPAAWFNFIPPSIPTPPLPVTPAPTLTPPQRPPDPAPSLAAAAATPPQPAPTTFNCSATLSTPAGGFGYHVKPTVVPLVCDRVSLPSTVKKVDMCALLPPAVSASLPTPPAACSLRSSERRAWPVSLGSPAFGRV